MSKKTICNYLTLAVASVLIIVPAYAEVTFDRLPIAHQWPTLAGSTPEVYSYSDPNSPAGASGPTQRVHENFDQGRGLMQTFTVAPWQNGEYTVDGNGAFTLTDIVITGTGPGSPTNTYSLHLFDINTAGQVIGWQPWQNTVMYRPDIDAMPPAYDWFSSCSFIYMEDTNSEPNDYFIRFKFSGYDKIDLEPNHLYAFEIWGSYVPQAGFYWIRDCRDNPYTGGRAYECSGMADGPEPGIGPPDLSAWRTAISQRDMTLGVYGVVADGNAYHPEPRNVEADVTVTPTLTWKPGKWAASTQGHRVWFHTALGAVYNRISLADKSYFNTCEYIPLSPLAFDVNYYWRVDEYNSVSNPGSYWPGPVWRFRTASPYAHNPNPASGTTGQFKLDTLNLTWTAGISAADTNGHRIYFGTDFNEINDALPISTAFYRGLRTEPNYPLVMLLEDRNHDLQPDFTLEEQTYYWRIDEINDANVWKGPVWSFIMPEFITVEDFNYFSTAELDAVWTAPVPNYCLSDCYASPGGIITLNNGAMRFSFDNSGAVSCPWSEAKADNNGTTLGQDWTIAGLINTASLSIGVDGNITSSIKDDYDHLYIAIDDTAGNFGIIYCDDAIIQKRQFGSTANSWNISLAELAGNGIPNAVDLRDINALYIGFGSRCSWGPPPFTYGGTGVITVDNIRLYMPRCLAEYEGHKSSQTGDFAGAYNGAGNWEPGDCDVDYYDLDYLSSVWLDSDVTPVYPNAVCPVNDSSRLMVWYKFDESSGDIAYDSSGNGMNGTVGNPHSLLWSTDGVSGNCLNLEAGLRTWIEVPPSAYPDPNNNPGVTGVTFSFWSAYDMNYPPIDDLAATWSSVFTMHSKIPTDANSENNNDDSQLIETQAPTPWPPNHFWGPQVRFADTRPESGTNVGRPGNPWVQYSNFGKRWNHYAFTYDEGNDIKAIYQNGALIASVEGEVNVPLPLWPAVGSFRIGTRSNRKYDPSWGFWYGKLDDFRIYNYALSENEIQWLATMGTGSRMIPLINNANLSPSSPEIIDFDDYALFMQNWLMQGFWP